MMTLVVIGSVCMCSSVVFAEDHSRPVGNNCSVEAISNILNVAGDVSVYCSDASTGEPVAHIDVTQIGKNRVRTQGNADSGEVTAYARVKSSKDDIERKQVSLVSYADITAQSKLFTFNTLRGAEGVVTSSLCTDEDGRKLHVGRRGTL